MFNLKKLIVPSIITCLVMSSTTGVFAQSNVNEGEKKSIGITIESKVISPNPPPIGYTGWATVTADIFNMYEKANINSPVMVQLPYGSSVYICQDSTAE